MISGARKTEEVERIPGHIAGTLLSFNNFFYELCAPKACQQDMALPIQLNISRI